MGCAFFGSPTSELQPRFDVVMVMCVCAACVATAVAVAAVAAAVLVVAESPTLGHRDVANGERSDGELITRYVLATAWTDARRTLPTPSSLVRYEAGAVRDTTSASCSCWHSHCATLTLSRSHSLTLSLWHSLLPLALVAVLQSRPASTFEAYSDAFQLHLIVYGRTCVCLSRLVRL